MIHCAASTGAIRLIFNSTRMFAIKDIPHKKPDEKIIIYVHPHWIHLLSAFGLFIIMSAIPVIIYLVSQSIFTALLENPIGYVVLILLLGIYYLAVLLITFNSILDRLLDVCAVTNYRIIAIEQKGLFNRTFAEHLIERIQDVNSVKKGMLETFLNYGNVEIQTAGEEEHFILFDVRDPERIVQTINDLLSQKIQNVPQEPKNTP